MNTVASTSSTLNFSTPANFSAGIEPINTLYFADINNDNLGDIIGIGTSQVISLLNKNNTPGNLTATFNPVNILFPPAIYSPPTNDLNFTDFNLDGKTDIAIAISGDDGPSVVLNATIPGSSDLKFNPGGGFTRIRNPESLLSGDVNNDGKPDLFSYHNTRGGSYEIPLLNKTPTGSNTVVWSDGSYKSGFSKERLLGDFNNDSRLDAVSQLNLFIGSDISIASNLTPIGSEIYNLAEPQYFRKGDGQIFTNQFLGMDVNSDGKLDIITSDAPVDVNSDKISVCLNTTPDKFPTFNLTSPQEILTDVLPKTMVSGDFNLDGKSDLGILTSDGQTLKILLNKTPIGALSSSWDTPYQINLSQNSESLTVGDVNQDGKSDLIVANQILNPSTQQLAPNIAVIINNTNTIPATNGTSGDDTLIGTAEIDTIYGQAGNDSIQGENAPDYLYGNDGNDFLLGGSGNDMLHGNEGTDTLSGETGNDTLYGGKQADILSGDKIDDLIGGNDLLFGNRENDQLFGGVANDTLLGGKDNDQLFGENGDDQLKGELGNDTLTGGGGADVFIIQLNGGNDQIVDFTDNVDKIGLSAGLTFQQLTINTVGNITNIAVGNQILATLNISSNLLSDNDFVIMA
jgi:Ca2+-binding RTX toxin-like protein